MRIYVVLVLVACSLSLSGCNTVKGIGQDMEATGRTISSI